MNRDDLRKSAQYQLMTSITSGNGTPKTWAFDVADRVLDEQAAMLRLAHDEALAAAVKALAGGEQTAGPQLPLAAIVRAAVDAALDTIGVTR